MIDEKVKNAVLQIRTDGKVKFCAQDVRKYCDVKMYTIRRNLAKLEKQHLLKCDEWFCNGDTKYYSFV